MKIGFPLKATGSKIMVDDFHGCHYIGIYDYANKTFAEVNVETLYSRSENYNLFSVMEELGIKVVVCKKMRPMALKFFNEQRITVYKAESDIVELNLELLYNGQLSRFLPQMAETSSCSSSCSSCSNETCSSQ